IPPRVFGPVSFGTVRIDLLLSRPLPYQFVRLCQCRQICACAVGSAFCIVERLSGRNTFFDEPLNTFELSICCLYIGLSSLDIGFRAVDLFRTRSSLQLLQTRLRGVISRFRLIVLSSVFAVFEAYDNLFALYSIALSDADP